MTAVQWNLDLTNLDITNVIPKLKRKICLDITNESQHVTEDEHGTDQHLSKSLNPVQQEDSNQSVNGLLCVCDRRWHCNALSSFFRWALQINH